MDEVLVTVICLTYNHAAYIRDALDGFVAQQTDFRFEVIVHDDASDDGTQDIIREYRRKYPELIHPVFQDENQYSKGVAIARTFLYPLIKGRYVAFCEGDDYWTDPLKLQKQVNVLENNPGVDICACRAEVRKHGVRAGFIAPRIKDSLLSVEDVIVGGGNYVATASLLCRTEAYMVHTPMRDVMVNDNVLQIQCSLRGGMSYMGDCMAVYRRGVPGSWSERHPSGDNHDRLYRMLDALDVWTSGRYHNAIVLRKRLYRSDELLRSNKMAMLYPGELRVSIRRLCRHIQRRSIVIYFRLFDK